VKYCEKLPRLSRRGRCCVLNKDGHRCSRPAVIETYIFEDLSWDDPARWVTARICSEHVNSDKEKALLKKGKAR